MIMRRLLFSTGNILLSLVLGAIAFGFVFLKYPDTMNQILDWASGFKAWLITRGLSPEYNNWVRVLAMAVLSWAWATCMAQLFTSPAPARAWCSSPVPGSAD
jgi:hypothetical protein